MAKNVVIRPSVREQYQKFMARGRVLFFTAPCGFGKSTLAETLLAGQQVLSLTAGEPDFALPADDKDWQVLLIDDLRQMTEEPDQQALCQLVREYSDRRFVLLSRGAVPGWLMAFQYAGLMAVLDADALLFDREDIRSLFRQQGTPVSESELSEILRETSGYPLGVAVIAHCMVGGRPYGPELIAQGYHEVFFYFEAAVYRRFDLPIRRFLLELAPFESFDAELARMVSGDPHAGERLAWLQHNTTMLRPDDVQRFRFWLQFRTFLLWEMDREYSEEKRRTVLGRGGLYYELKEDYSHALECYTMAGDHSKVSELLVRNAELHPGMGHYSEMEKYYRSLPEQEIAASPALMQGMSMLCALAADYEGSERWYQALSQFARCRAKSDAAGRQARGRLAWLDISLPQRGVTDLTAIIPSAYRLLVNKEVTLPAFSVTSALPSIMNGGKDFSEWSRRDDLLYQTIRVPVEAILGRDGVGLPDCAIAESKFEKGEDITARMLALMPRLGEIQRDGTPDIEFAAVGLLARSQLAAGHSQDARRTLESLRQRFAEGGQSRFLPNIDAMLCRVDLRTGDTDAVDSWYREKAPRDPPQHQYHEALPVLYSGHGGACSGPAAGRPAYPGSAGTLLHRLPAEDGSHHPAAFAGRGPVPAKGRSLAAKPYRCPAHCRRVGVHPPGKLLRRRPAAPAAGPAQPGGRELVPAGGGLCPGAGRPVSLLPGAAPAPRRGNDRHRAAGAAPDVRR